MDLVNGSWTTADHQNMISGSINASYIALMQKVVYEADHTYQTTQHLHGLHNYVKGLKFLYKCSRYLKMGKDQETAIQLAKSGAGIDTSNTHDVALVKQTRNLLNTDYGYVDNTTSATKSYKVLGFAMHLVGDTYAHRTIVPTYTVADRSATNVKTSSKPGVARFGTSDFINDKDKPNANALKSRASEAYKYVGTNDCKGWNCLKRTVELGVMEFRDIKYYMKTPNNQTYEDNNGFCAERFRDAQYNCNILMTYYQTNSTYDGVGILAPIEDHVVLNGFKKYVKNSGENINYYTEEEWAEISTPDLY